MASDGVAWIEKIRKLLPNMFSCVVMPLPSGCHSMSGNTSSLVKDHIRYPRYAALRLPPQQPKTAADLHGLAFATFMRYEGTYMNTASVDGSSFQCSAREVPYFPSFSRLVERVTFWRWRATDDHEDLLVAPAQALLVSLIQIARRKNGCPSWRPRRRGRSLQKFWLPQSASTHPYVCV